MKIFQHTFNGKVLVGPADYTKFPGMAFSNGLVGIVLEKSRSIAAKPETLVTYIPYGLVDKEDMLGFVEGLASNAALHFMELKEVSFSFAAFAAYQLLVRPHLIYQASE